MTSKSCCASYSHRKTDVDLFFAKNCDSQERGAKGEKGAKGDTGARGLKGDSGCEIINSDAHTRVSVCTAGIAQTRADQYELTTKTDAIDPFSADNTEGENIHYFDTQQAALRSGNFRRSDLDAIGSVSTALGKWVKAGGQASLTNGYSDGGDITNFGTACFISAVADSTGTIGILNSSGCSIQGSSRTNGILAINSGNVGCSIHALASASGNISMRSNNHGCEIRGEAIDSSVMTINDENYASEIHGFSSSGSRLVISGSNAHAVVSGRANNLSTMNIGSGNHGACIHGAVDTSGEILMLDNNIAASIRARASDNSRILMETLNHGSDINGEVSSGSVASISVNNIGCGIDGQFTLNTNAVIGSTNHGSGIHGSGVDSNILISTSNAGCSINGSAKANSEIFMFTFNDGSSINGLASASGVITIADSNKGVHINGEATFEATVAVGDNNRGSSIHTYASSGSSVTVGNDTAASVIRARTTGSGCRVSLANNTRSCNIMVTASGNSQVSIDAESDGSQILGAVRNGDITIGKVALGTFAMGLASDGGSITARDFSVGCFIGGFANNNGRIDLSPGVTPVRGSIAFGIADDEEVHSVSADASMALGKNCSISISAPYSQAVGYNALGYMYGSQTASSFPDRDDAQRGFCQTVKTHLRSFLVAPGILEFELGDGTFPRLPYSGRARVTVNIVGTQTSSATLNFFVSNNAAVYTVTLPLNDDFITNQTNAAISYTAIGGMNSFNVQITGFGTESFYARLKLLMVASSD